MSQSMTAAAGGAEASPAAPAEAAEAAEATASGEMMGLSTLQWNRNRKAIEKTLDELASGDMTEAKARVFLGAVGMSQASIDALVADAMDGTIDTPLPEATADV
jgi:hypothetical protein